MHRLISIITIGMLLSSCEPGADSSAATTAPLREQGGILKNSLPVNNASDTQLAAQNSVGKPPAPLDMIASVADTCPVHHERMKVCEIPIVHEEDSQTGHPSATAAFPFGAEKIISAGNVLLPSEPVSARVYQCASCVAVRIATEEKMRKQAAAPPQK